MTEREIQDEAILKAVGDIDITFAAEKAVGHVAKQLRKALRREFTGRRPAKPREVVVNVPRGTSLVIRFEQ